MRSISVPEKREELQRILASRYFAKAPKKSRFLEFICDRSFQGQAEQTSEYLVGVEVYERGDDFNPHEDSIVRVQAHEIRKSLKAYYRGEGNENKIRLELPPGHYVPGFTRSANGSSAPVDIRSRYGQLFRSIPWMLALGFAALSAVLAFLLLREANTDGRPSAVAWSTSYSADMDWFWGPFLPPAARPLIVVPVHPLLRAVHDGDSEATKNSGFPIRKVELPEFRDTIHYRELQSFRFVPSITDFTAVGETLGLAAAFRIIREPKPTRAGGSRQIGGLWRSGAQQYHLVGRESDLERADICLSRRFQAPRRHDLERRAKAGRKGCLQGGVRSPDERFAKGLRADS